MPRLACPNWRCMTFSGTPSRAISTGVGVTELMRREAATDTGGRCELPQRGPRGGWRPWPSFGGSVEDAEPALRRASRLEARAKR